MPKYDKNYLRRQAAELGFIRDTFEKVLRLTEVLRFIGASAELEDSLALKGGTAINLTILDMPRLSVDIDFDFAKNLPREQMLAVRQRNNQLIGRFMAAEGYASSAKSKS